jgi:O-antigen/teichoic acid export membrane protein
MFAACAALALAAPVLVLALFGSEFAAASRVLRLLLPGVLILTVGKVIAPFVCNRGRPAVATYVSLGALGLTVVLNVLLIPPLGIAGSAIASSISYAANGTAFAVIFLRMSGLSVRHLFGPPEVGLCGLGTRWAKLVSAAFTGGVR